MVVGVDVEWILEWGLTWDVERGGNLEWDVERRGSFEWEWVVGLVEVWSARCLWRCPQ